MRVKEPRVLVSILNYNSYDNTIVTIECFLKQDYRNMHLMLVDNGSSDGSADRIQARFPKLEMVRTGKNLGYTGGNNFALEYGVQHGYDDVVIANEDIEVDEDAISNMVRASLMDDQAGLVGGWEWCFFTGEKRALGGEGYDFWRSRARWKTSATVTDSRPIQVDYVQGALVLFSRRALERGVRMNEDLFIYYDEVELGLQTRRQGLRNYVVPTVVIKHKNKPAWFSVRSGYLHQRNRWYMVRRYGRWYHRVFYFLYATLGEVPAKYVIRTIQGHGDFAVAALIGHVDGMMGKMGSGRLFSLRVSGSPWR
jgi:GT2 family glycosyltransferase